MLNKCWTRVHESGFHTTRMFLQVSAICKTAADGTCARPTKWSPGSGFVARWTG